jgi:chromosome segregation ATPase
MFLKELTKIQTAAADQKGDRQKISNEACQQGLRLLQQVSQSNPPNPAELKKAFRDLVKAIQYNRRNSAAYMGCAYLQVMAKNEAMARKYLQELLKIEPEHAAAQDLLQFITKQGKAPAKLPTLAAQSPLQLKPEPPKEQDLDALYDQVEAHLMGLQKQLLGLSALLKPSLKPEATEALRQEQQHLQALLKGLNRQIEMIDQEIETTELRQQIRPFETLLKRAESVLTIAHEMAELQTRMESAEERLKHLSDRLKGKEMGLSSAEAELESIMDLCDACADEIDSLENAKHDVSELVPLYENLINQLESSRDLIEDMNE